jgi:hypothetical protein
MQKRTRCDAYAPSANAVPISAVRLDGSLPYSLPHSLSLSTHPSRTTCPPWWSKQGTTYHLLWAPARCVYRGRLPFRYAADCWVIVAHLLQTMLCPFVGVCLPVFSGTRP